MKLGMVSVSITDDMAGLLRGLASTTRRNAELLDSIAKGIDEVQVDSTEEQLRARITKLETDLQLIASWAYQNIVEGTAVRKDSYCPCSFFSDGYIDRILKPWRMTDG